MKLTKSSFFLIVDYGMILILLSAGFAFQSGGPFIGAAIYACFRYVFAAVVSDPIYDRTSYRILDLLLFAGFLTAGFVFPSWDGGPFWGAGILIVLRFIYEAAMD